MLAKETVTLHKVLSRYLSVSVVEVSKVSVRCHWVRQLTHLVSQFVMTQVFAAINHRLSEEYATIELPSMEAKERYEYSNYLQKLCASDKIDI